MLSVVDGHSLHVRRKEELRGRQGPQVAVARAGPARSTCDCALASGRARAKIAIYQAKICKKAIVSNNTILISPINCI